MPEKIHYRIPTNKVKLIPYYWEIIQMDLVSLFSSTSFLSSRYKEKGGLIIDPLLWLLVSMAKRIIRKKVDITTKIKEQTHLYIYLTPLFLFI